MRANEFVSEKWSAKYKRSINCAHPQGFSQRTHCQGRAKNEEQLDELQFLGSECTKDCSGHRAGYEWYKRKSRDPYSNSPSFNNGATLARMGK
jgi:hypothetical protein